MSEMRGNRIHTLRTSDIQTAGFSELAAFVFCRLMEFVKFALEGIKNSHQYSSSGEAKSRHTENKKLKICQGKYEQICFVSVSEENAGNTKKGNFMICHLRELMVDS